MEIKTLAPHLAKDLTRDMWSPVQYSRVHKNRNDLRIYAKKGDFAATFGLNNTLIYMCPSVASFRWATWCWFPT